MGTQDTRPEHYETITTGRHFSTVTSRPMHMHVTALLHIGTIIFPTQFLGSLLQVEKFKFLME